VPECELPHKSKGDWRGERGGETLVSTYWEIVPWQPELAPRSAALGRKNNQLPRWIRERVTPVQ